MAFVGCPSVCCESCWICLEGTNIGRGRSSVRARQSSSLPTAGSESVLQRPKTHVCSITVLAHRHYFTSSEGRHMFLYHPQTSAWFTYFPEMVCRARKLQSCRSLSARKLPRYMPILAEVEPYTTHVCLNSLLPAHRLRYSVLATVVSERCAWPHVP
eukprot:scaffold388_cov380-Prasinococcus_capsulatus_cf.AAC.38